MTKFTKLNYVELNTKKINDFESSFALKPLERGFANTLGNAIRRTLLSSIKGVAPFATKIANVDHEFQTLTGIKEDVVQIILNIKGISFIYNEEIFKDGEVLKVSLKSGTGEITAADLELPTGVQVVNPDEYIATSQKNGALEFEMFLTVGRGFISFEDNKNLINEFASKIDSKLKTGTLIAIDSDFSPIEKVSYETIELNSSSKIIEEQLVINVKTNGSIESKEAIAQASNVLGQHLQVLTELSNLKDESIFEEKVVEEKASTNKKISISALELSKRPYNCLSRANIKTLEDLSVLTVHELKEINNLGEKSVEEIIKKLEDHGIILEGEE